MNNEIKEITAIITRLQDCGRKRISPTEGVIVNNKDIATALHKAGYRKQSDTVKEFAEKLKKELFAKCVVIQSISNTQTEDMNSTEAYTVIEQLAEQYGKEEK